MDVAASTVFVAQWADENSFRRAEVADVQFGIGLGRDTAGVSTKRHQGAGLFHGYFGMGGEASEAARLEAQRARADFKAMLERGA